ncbi:hypothetical protein FHG87_024374 [Trinorchestia longiramus]|nr:hypothetical protein FHG87_024374 [Trinorchestia longiramus]
MVSIDRLNPAYVAPTIKQLPNPSVSPANPSVSPTNPSVSPANPSVSPATPSVSPPTVAHFNSSPPVLHTCCSLVTLRDRTYPVLYAHSLRSYSSFQIAS